MAQPKKQRKTVPRRVRTITEEELPPEIDGSAPIDEELLELETFFNEIGAGEDVRYKLYRVLKGGRRTWLEDGTPETFSEASIQESYGEGDYLIRAISGRHWMKSKQISIGAPRQSLQSSGSSEQVRALELRLRELELQAQQARESEMRRQHELSLKLIDSMGSRNVGPVGPTLNELIVGVRNLRDLGGNNHGTTIGSIKETLELVEQVNALRGEQPKEDDRLLSVLKPILPELTRVFLPGLSAAGGHVGASTMSGQPALATGPNPEAASPADGPTATAQTLTDEQFNAVKKQLIAYGIGLADAGRSPELYADMAIETCDVQRDPVSARVISEVVNAADFAAWFISIEKLEPATVTRRSWFEAFFNTVREIVAGQNQPEMEVK
jgi:hypothetical protein